jgi:hypothetical protein
VTGHDRTTARVLDGHGIDKCGPLRQRRSFMSSDLTAKGASKREKEISRNSVVGRLDTAVPREELPRSDDWVKGGAEHAWYIPRTNTYPTEQALFDADLARVIHEYVLPGHLPTAPALDETQPVVTLGSCFARELLLFLQRSGANSTRFWIPSGLNNTFAILDFFSWCITGEQTGRGYRYERGAGGDIQEWVPPAERDAYLGALSGAGAFVFTLGLAEVWQDRDTGHVFWRGIPRAIFDSNRHVFRLTTVDENTDNLRRTIELIRKVNTEAPIVLTLSPVPLLASFRDISCLSADCVSKSVLRVALDQVMTAPPPGVYYWPSFEIVKWVGATLPYSAYGEGGKSRDVNRAVVTAIIDAFIEAFYKPDALDRMRAHRDAPRTGAG